jgi:hypothetical protein
MEASIVIGIVFYFIFGGVTTLVAHDAYYQKDFTSIAIGFFWPLVWFFGLIKMLLTVIKICWHMFF